MSREKARRLTLGYQRDWDDSGLKGSREAKKHSRQRWGRHKKTEFRQLAARERDDEPLPGGRRVYVSVRSAINYYNCTKNAAITVIEVFVSTLHTCQATGAAADYQPTASRGHGAG